MREVILIRYGEIGTKSSRTRRKFISRLIFNISEALRSEGIPFRGVENRWSRIIVRTGREAIPTISRVFGISSISPALEVKTDLEEICLACEKIYSERGGKFRISARRLWKGFEKSSMEINSEVGRRICEKFSASVDLKRPDVEIGIEVMKRRSYVFSEKIGGVGGLPIGVEGSLISVVRNREEMLNCWLGMRRGAEVKILSSSPKFLEPLKKYSYGNRHKAKICEDPVGRAIELIEDFEGILVVGEEVPGTPNYDLVSYLPEEIKNRFYSFLLGNEIL